MMTFAHETTKAPRWGRNLSSCLGSALLALFTLGCDPGLTGGRGSSSIEDQEGIDPSSNRQDDGERGESGDVGEDQEDNQTPQDPEPQPEPQPDFEQDGCEKTTFAPDVLPPNVMLVVDKSGSMFIKRWMDNGVDRNRWESLHETVAHLVDKLGDRINFGLKLFPSLPEEGQGQVPTSCVVDEGVDVDCAPQSAADIMSRMPGAMDRVAGSTPITAGVSAAYEYLKTLDDDNPEAMILVVDGGMSCNESQQGLEDLASEAAGAGIPIYVVGIDLQQRTSATLNRVARAAGTDKVYNAASRDVLVTSLESVVGNIVSCHLPLDNPPPYSDKVRVRIGGDDSHPWIEGASSCAEAKAKGKSGGWVYLDSDPAFTQIELCGSTCAAYRADPVVDVVFDCPPAQ